MQLDVDANFTGKTPEELCSQLNQVFSKLFATLQKQPNFHLDVDPATPLPNDLPPKTIIFQLTANNTLRVGIFDGQNTNHSL